MLRKWISAMGIKGWLLVALFVFIFVIIVVAYYILNLPSKDGEQENIALFADVVTALAGVGTSLLAVWGIFLFLKRNELLGRQVEVASDTQASNQLTQGMDLLTKVDNDGNPLIVSSIGGLYSLESLVNAKPDAYGAQVMKTIVAYIRNNAQKTALDMPNEPEKRKKPSPLGEDVKTAFAVLERLYERHKKRLIKEGKLHR